MFVYAQSFSSNRNETLHRMPGSFSTVFLVANICRQDAMQLPAQTPQFPKVGDWIPASAPLLQIFLLLLEQPCNMQHIAALIIAHAQARLLLKTSPPNKANPSFSFTMWYLRLLHIFKYSSNLLQALCQPLLGALHLPASAQTKGRHPTITHLL